MSYGFGGRAATEEQAELMQDFIDLLLSPGADGGRKRAAGAKVDWRVDTGHLRAVYSHLGKHAAGERVDADSGAHPLAHCAWRCLAVAWVETHGR